LDAGYRLCIYDSNPEATKPLVARGAKLAKSPAEVASSSDIVFLSLPTPPIVTSVVLGPNGVSQGNAVTTVVDLSTTGPSAALPLAKALGERQIPWIDPPVSGGVPGAEKGTLAVTVSGPKGAADAADPILKVFGKTFYTGEKPGLAQVAKLGNNLLAAAAVVLSSEA